MTTTLRPAKLEFAGPGTYWGEILLIALGYAALGLVGNTFAVVGGVISPLWPASGLALAALMIRGPSRWPGIALGNFLMHLLIGIADVWVMSLFMLGATAEAWVAAWALNRTRGFRPDLGRVEDVLWFFVIAVVVSPLLSLIPTLTGLWLEGLLTEDLLFRTIWAFWVGDGMGNWLITPFCLLLFAPETRARISPRRVPEAILTWVSLCAGSLLILRMKQPVAFLTFPLILWVAIHFERLGVVIAVLSVGVISVVYTFQGLGPFVHAVPVENVALLQLFLATSMGTGLIASSGMKARSERKWLAERVSILEREQAALAREQKAYREIENERVKFEKLLSVVPDLITMHEGPDHRYVFANPQALSFLGLRADQVLGKSLREVIKDAPDAWERCDRVYREGVVIEDHAFKIPNGRNPDGSERFGYLNFVIQPVRDVDGRVHGVMTYSSDVTEEVVSRRRIEQSEAHFRQLAEAIPQLVWTTKPNDGVDYMNSRWVEYTGISMKEALGTSGTAALHPDMRDAIFRQWVDAHRRGDPFEIEYLIRRRDGQYRWHLARSVPIRDAQGNIVKWFGTATDIHEQREALEKARIAQERLEVALTAADMAVWELDLETMRFSRSQNHFRLYGVGEPQLDAWSPEAVRRFVHPEDYEAYMAEAQKILAGETDTLSQEFRVIWPDGSVHWLAQRGKVTERVGNKPWYMRGAVVDITKLKTVEEELKRALRMRDEFLSIASHELKTPLTPLRVYFEMLMQARKPGNELMLDSQVLGEIIENSHQEISRLTRLVENLLDVTKIKAGKLKLRLEQFDLRMIPQEVTKRFAGEARSAHCEVELHLPSEPVTGLWDRLRLEQVLTNLFNNALKYAPGAPITLGVERQPGSEVRIWVQDRGPGIPKGLQAKIFDRFERAGAPTEITGLGLGLYIVEQIVRAHQGRIELQSEEGKGALFTVYLPLETKPGEHGW